jgi:NTP pyrophosphatase (non-canonical NTP hydrolase)
MVEINYTKNIIDLLEIQRQKGIAKYGQILEDNTTLSRVQRIEHIEEELIDALMYAEHIKAAVEDSLTANDYQRMAMRTASGLDKHSLILNGVMGLNGESGECIDIMKKHIFQGHELDREHLIEELGDVAWYLAVCCEGLGVSLEEVMEKNIEKLKARYPEGFDKARSINRTECEPLLQAEEIVMPFEKPKRKTYLEDFLEKENLKAEDVVSHLCVKERYKSIPETEQWVCDKNCSGCWNSEMPKEK